MVRGGDEEGTGLVMDREGNNDIIGRRVDGTIVRYWPTNLGSTWHSNNRN